MRTTVGADRSREHLEAHAVGDTVTHVALRVDHRIVKGEVGHPVGLEGHHGAEMLAGAALEISGVIVGGEGVLLPAQARHHLGELAGRVALGSLEHQVLEEMRDARLPDRVVCGTVAVPHHVGHDRHPVIRHDHHVEAVVESEGGDLRPAALRAPERRLVGARIRGGQVVHGMATLTGEGRDARSDLHCRRLTRRGSREPAT